MQFHCLPPCDLNRPSRPSLSSLTLCFVPSAVPPSMPSSPPPLCHHPLPSPCLSVSSPLIPSILVIRILIFPRLSIFCVPFIYLFFFPSLLRWQSRLVVSETIPITVRLWIQSRRQGLCTSTGGCAVEMTLGVMLNTHLRSHFEMAWMGAQSRCVELCFSRCSICSSSRSGYSQLMSLTLTYTHCEPYQSLQW